MMKAMIFAAGLGTRLKPITDTLPKALVPVAGKPLIEHVCHKLKKAGIEEAVVNVHHFADKVEEWVADQQIMSLQISDEREGLLETGGAVLHAREYLKDCGRFLIHNVDILSNLDLGWFESSAAPDAMASLLVSRRETSRMLLFDPKTMRLVGWYNSSTGQIRSPYEDVDPDKCLAFAFSGIHIMETSTPRPQRRLSTSFAACRRISSLSWSHIISRTSSTVQQDTSEFMTDLLSSTTRFDLQKRAMLP